MDQVSLTALHRATAMTSPHTMVSVLREDVLDIVGELLTTRALLARLGTQVPDLRIGVASSGRMPR